MARAGQVLDVLAQVVFLAVLLAVLAVTEWLITPTAYLTGGPGGAALVITILTSAGVVVTLLCAVRWET